MTCKTHSWNFDMPCPECGPAIPTFLQRKGNDVDTQASADKRKAEYAKDDENVEA